MLLEAKGVSAHVSSLGEGPPLLLLHGWGPSTVTADKHMKPLAQRFQSGYQVYALDFPGHGQSGMPGADWGVPEYAAWLLSLMDTLAIQTAPVIAHSFGGRVALYLAAHHPERVSALVLTGCAGIRPKKSLIFRLNAMMFKTGRVFLQIMRLAPGLRRQAEQWLVRLREDFSSRDYLATPEALRGSFSRIVRLDLRPFLPKIQQPTLLVWGEKDSATPLWMGRVMEKEMPDAKLLVYEADDHWAYKNQLERFATAAGLFLQEVSEA